jgi:hypothetical protein
MIIIICPEKEKPILDGRFGVVVGIPAYYSRVRGFDLFVLGLGVSM